MERLGILGGTFDPVHVAHLAAASAAGHQLALDRVLLMVARYPWQKHGRVDAPAEARYAMVAAAIEGVEKLEASRLELERDGPTYTADTVAELTEPGRELFLIVGADVAASLDTWDRVGELQERVTLALVDRPDGPSRVSPVGWRTVSVHMPRLDISSSELRRRIVAGEPVDFLIPAAAVQIIRSRGLYTAR